MEHLCWDTNEVTTKMAEQTQLQQIMTKDWKKVPAGRKLTECNRKKREELAKTQKNESESKLTLGQYYSSGAVMTVGAFFFITFTNPRKEIPPR